MTPEQEQFDANLDLLFSIHFEGMDQIARQNLLDTREDIREEYQMAVDKGKSEKKYKDIAESMAKSLTGITKGALSAATAFQKGDNISGAAAVMDICASVVPIFASFAGPEGAVAGAFIGAIFSCVGQILAFFAPKQPSLEEKIQKMLDHSQSEEQIRLLKGVGLSINTYAKDLKRKSMGVHKFEQNVLAGTVALTTNSATVTGTGTTFKTLGVGESLVFDSDTSQKLYEISEITNDTSLKLKSPYSGASTATSPVKHLVRKILRRSVKEILEMPLETEAQADDFSIEMGALKMGLIRIQQKTNVTAFNIWTVAGYLEREENQVKEGWPEVLGTWCHMYSDLLNANMLLKCLAPPKMINKQRAKVEPGKCSLHESTRAECHKQLIELAALTKDLEDAWTSDGAEALKVLNNVTPVAKERGLYAHLGFRADGLALYISVRNRNSKKELGWDYKNNTAWLRTISIGVPLAEKGSFTPQYGLLLLEYDHHVSRFWLDSVTGALTGSVLLLANSNQYPNRDGNITQTYSHCVDACWLPGSSEGGGDDPNATRVFTAHNDGKFCYVNAHLVDANNNVKRYNWEPHTSNNLTFIRALDRVSSTTLSDDPDGPAMPPGPYNIIYGGYLDYPKIWVQLQDSWANVPSPWSDEGYLGIEVDPHYLWVCGKRGIACATHASVVKCKKGEIPHPNWFYHDFKENFHGPFPMSIPVNSLSPCADGTLTVSLGDKKIYTADYKIDRASKRIVISSLSSRGGSAAQIVKMPIPCWPVLESLKANLTAV